MFMGDEDGNPLQSLQQNCRHLYRHQKVRKLRAKPGDGANRRIGWKEIRVLFIQADPVARPRQQYLDLDDILELCAGGAQNVLAVDERLPRLLLDRRPGLLIRLRIDAEHTRHIYGRTYFYCLTVQR